MRGLLAAVVVLLVVAAPSGAAPRQPKLCGRISVRHAGYGVSVERGRISCHAARRVLRVYLTAPRSRCAGSHCLITIRGWDCIAGGWDGPQAAECTRGRRRATAYRADV